MSQKFIHKKECGDCQTGFKDKQTTELLDEDKIWQDTAGRDALKRLGPISKEEADYYANL